MEDSADMNIWYCIKKKRKEKTVGSNPSEQSLQKRSRKKWWRLITILSLIKVINSVTRGGWVLEKTHANMKKNWIAKW